MTQSGYILDINEDEKKVDLQLYESVQGTSILEGLNPVSYTHLTLPTILLV